MLPLLWKDFRSAKHMAKYPVCLGKVFSILVRYSWESALKCHSDLRVIRSYISMSLTLSLVFTQHRSQTEPSSEPQQPNRKKKPRQHSQIRTNSPTIQTGTLAHSDFSLIDQKFPRASHTDSSFRFTLTGPLDLKLEVTSPGHLPQPTKEK